MDELKLKRGKWVFDEKTGTLREYGDPKPSEVEAPFVVTDEISATRNHADGKLYTSKAKFRDAVKSSGYVATEGVFNTASKRKETSEREYADALEQARNLVKNGMAPLSELDKEICKRQNQNIKRPA